MGTSGIYHTTDERQKISWEARAHVYGMDMTELIMADNCGDVKGPS